MSKKQDLSRYRTNRQSEVESAALYRAMQAVEKNPQVAEVYGRLAAVEEAHASFWHKRIVAAGGMSRSSRGCVHVP